MTRIGFLFDLDGVLIDSEKEYTRIWEEIERAFPTGQENFANKIKGQTLTKILNDNFKEEEREQVTSSLYRMEKEMTYSYCEGAEKFLQTLMDMNVDTAVVTSSDKVKMNHLYDDLPEFRGKVNIVIDASKVVKSKPDPEGYCLAASELGKDIRNCVVFEDSVQGVRAGRSAGAYVIGITGTKTREDLRPYSDMVIDSLEEIDIDALTTLLKNR